MRVRSWGLVRKRGNAGKVHMEIRGTCIMGGVSADYNRENSTASGSECTVVGVDRQDIKGARPAADGPRCRFYSLRSIYRGL